MTFQIPTENTDIDLSKTLYSGQCFSWQQLNQHHYGFINNKLVRLTQTENSIEVRGDITLIEVREYLDLDTDYTHMFDNLDMNNWEIICFCNGIGIHILRQELFETIITLMITPRNKMENTRAIVNAIKRNYGQRCELDDIVDYTFPLVQQLSTMTEEDARNLGMGYRAPYIVEFIQLVHEHHDIITRIAEATFPDSVALLQQHKGIGPKVANCVSLFSLHQLKAFPIDTHLEDIIYREYNHRFDVSRFGECAGVMQQYMYYTEAISFMNR